MSGKNWIIWSATNIVLGILGYILLCMTFVMTLTLAGGNAPVIYMALSVVGLLLLLAFHFTNRSVYKGMSERCKETIPPIMIFAGNILSWMVLIGIYLVMAYL